MTKTKKLPLITMTEAGKELGITMRTVHHHVAKLKLGQKYGKVLLLDEDDMVALRGRKTTPGREKAQRNDN